MNTADDPSSSQADRQLPSTGEPLLDRASPWRGFAALRGESEDIPSNHSVADLRRCAERPGGTWALFSITIAESSSALGRSARFFLVAGTLYFFGPSVKRLLEKYFDWFAWALLALGIGGFLAVKYIKVS